MSLEQALADNTAAIKSFVETALALKASTDRQNDFLSQALARASGTKTAAAEPAKPAAEAKPETAAAEPAKPETARRGRPAKAETAAKPATETAKPAAAAETAKPAAITTESIKTRIGAWLSQVPETDPVRGERRDLVKACLAKLGVATLSEIGGNPDKLAIMDGLVDLMVEGIDPLAEPEEEGEAAAADADDWA